MRIKKSLLDYENHHNNKFVDTPIQVLYKKNNYLFFNTKFGICKKNITNFLKGTYTLQSAVNKTEYLKNKLNYLYGDKYDYSLVKWTASKEKVSLICKKHGICEINTNSLLVKNGGCKLCGYKNLSDLKAHNTIFFVNKANIIHNFKYNYNNAFYDRSFKNITIICPIHGEFTQRAAHHLKGHGCSKCSDKKVADFNSKNSPGWNLKSWIEKAKKSLNFDSFKIYIIKCWNDDEEFYKIGRTFKLVEKRFGCKKTMPYNYEILKTYKNNAKTIYNIETKLKKKYSKNKYIPKIKFAGMQECFIIKKDLWLEKLFSYV